MPANIAINTVNNRFQQRPRIIPNTQVLCWKLCGCSVPETLFAWQGVGGFCDKACPYISKTPHGKFPVPFPDSTPGFCLLQKRSSSRNWSTSHSVAVSLRSCPSISGSTRQLSFILRSSLWLLTFCVIIFWDTPSTTRCFILLVVPSGVTAFISFDSMLLGA